MNKKKVVLYDLNVKMLCKQLLLDEVDVKHL